VASGHRCVEYSIVLLHVFIGFSFWEVNNVISIVLTRIDLRLVNMIDFVCRHSHQALINFW
jgi:hypothetical protein